MGKIFTPAEVSSSSGDQLEAQIKRVLESGRYTMSGYPSGYSDLEVYSIAFVAIILMAVIIGGNCIVIIAIFFEYSLQVYTILSHKLGKGWGDWENLGPMMQ